MGVLAALGGRWPTLPGPPPGTSDVMGPVTHIRDGDTIEVAGVAVRIANLDCAARDTRAGQEALAAMRDLVAGQEVACALEGRRSYDREVGTCALGLTGEDLGERLIADGSCERWRG